MIDFSRVVLVHYHEIGLKGHNRSSFEKRLQRNLEALFCIGKKRREQAQSDPEGAGSLPGALAGSAVERIDRISGRILVTLRGDATADQAIECAEFASRVPGVARVSTGYKVERELDAISEAAAMAMADSEPFCSFKVQARRAHTDFPINSMEMNRLVGAFLCERFPEKTVRMKDFDVQIGVEVVQNSAYVHGFSIPGVGGLPVGSSGKVCSLLSSGIDSPVALWQLARRGAVCIGVHFSGRPETSDVSEFLVADIAKVLQRTGCISKVFTCPIGEYQREISLYAPPKLRVILYRRLMMKVADEIANREGAGALVTGESLGQVASQTLDNIRCTDAAVNMPVFRPLIGTDKQKIIAMSKELGTYEISTQDAPDCCTLFMPRSPETHGKLDEVEEAESRFPIDAWVKEIADSAEAVKYAVL